MSDVGWPQARLHIVTGKGGTGKTTVAAALAVAMADQGRRVLLAEVEERQGISQTFDVPPLGSAEVKVAVAAAGGEVYGLSVDARTALLEYLQIFYKLGRAGGVLERFGAIDFATTIAPGVRDVLLVGRIYEAARRRHDQRYHRHSHPDELAYDAIVMDAPPTGRVCRFLSVGSEVAGLARVGPIRSQADSMTGMLHSPNTVVHVVTLLEEMPVQETVDVVAELRSIGMPVGAVVVNQARTGNHEGTHSKPPQAIDPARLRADLGSVGVTLSNGLVDGLVRDVQEHAERLSLESAQLDVIETLGMPVVTVPALVDGIDSDAIFQIAELLAQQGMTP
ncbi:MAG: ArsA-related P-loop ATPase [Dermatophilaceae bacterium]